MVLLGVPREGARRYRLSLDILPRRLRFSLHKRENLCEAPWNSSQQALDAQKVRGWHYSTMASASIASSTRKPPNAMQRGSLIQST